MSQTFRVRCPRCGQKVTAAYTDEPVQDIQCPSCQQTFCLFVRKQRFEVLFDLATAALLAGYAREAVSGFAAALERAFEFYTRAAALEAWAAGELDLAAAEQLWQQTWRLVDRQSERQTGMFAYAYMQREGRPPQMLKPQALGSEFRNAVIHRGHLPERAEVEAYAAQIFDVIDGLLSDLGEATLQVQALDELAFGRHFAALPPGTPAVIEEHPGVFRARMFGRFSGSPAAWSSGKGGGEGRAELPALPANQNPGETFRLALAYFGGGELPGSGQ